LTKTCPFCDKSVDRAIFASSENFLAIYNIAPVLPGHSLIIPRRHIYSVLELSESELCDMMIFSKKITELILTAFNAEAFNWSIQEKEAAGQSVSHLHLHIVPRYSGDLTDPGDWYPKIESNYEEILDSVNRRKLSQHNMDQIVGKLRSMAKNKGLFISD
jgi:bis(5'-adenosyl)-triphosphatase